MFIDDKKRALSRILIGGGLGMMGCLLLGWLSQPGALFGGWNGDNAATFAVGAVRRLPYMGIYLLL